MVPPAIFLDFTKHYNRLRHQLQPNKSTNQVVVAPAANVPRKTTVAPKKAADVAQQKDEDSKMLGDQIEALSTKFEGRIHLGESAPSVAEIKMGSKKAAGDR